MKLASIRELSGLKPVLKDSMSNGPDPVYWVFGDITEGGKWANLTIIASGNFNGEYPKTYGHYHGQAINETYHLVSGKGILIMQKKHEENGQIVPDKVDEVYFIQAEPGDDIVITPEWGHSWSNIGDIPLLSFDDWRSGHSPSDYEPMEQMQGLAYYLVNENGEVKAVPNPKYRDLPDPVWTTATEWKSRQPV